MKKFLLSILAIGISIMLGFSACGIIAIQTAIEGYLPGMINSHSDSGSPGKDSVKYKKTTYEDTEKLRKKLENHKNFVLVENDDVEFITSFFDDFDGWAEVEGFYPEYDFDKNCIGEGDYYYIENVETHGEPLEDVYRTYEVYYFDIQSMALYYIHISI